MSKKCIEEHVGKSEEMGVETCELLGFSSGQ